MAVLERKPEVPASIPDEDLGPGRDCRGIPRGPSQLARRLDFPEANQRVPEVPIVTGEEHQVSCCNSRITRRFSLQREMRTFSTVTSLVKSHLPSRASKGFLTPLIQLKKFPNIPVSTREEHQGSCHKSRRVLFIPPHLEMRVPFPASSGKKSWHCCRTSRGGSLNLNVERNSRGCATIPKDPYVPVHSRYT